MTRFDVTLNRKIQVVGRVAPTRRDAPFRLVP